MGNVNNTKDLNTETLQEYVLSAIERATVTLIGSSITEKNMVCKDNIHPGLHTKLCKETFLDYIKDKLKEDGYVLSLETLLNFEIINLFKETLLSTDICIVLSSSEKENFYSMYKLIYRELDDKNRLGIDITHVFNVSSVPKDLLELLNIQQVELKGIKYSAALMLISNGKILDWYKAKLENFVLVEILEKTKKAYIDSVKANIVPENKIETSASMKSYRGTDFYVNLNIDAEFMDIRKRILENSCFIKISKDEIGGRYSVVVYNLSYYVNGDNINVFMNYSEENTEYLLNIRNTFNIKEKYEQGEYHIIKIFNVNNNEEDDVD